MILFVCVLTIKKTIEPTKMQALSLIYYFLKVFRRRNRSDDSDGI